MRDTRVLFISVLLCIGALSLSRSVSALVADGVWRFRRAFAISLPPAILFGLVAAALVLWGLRSSFARRQFSAWAAGGAVIGMSLAVLWWGLIPFGGVSELMMFAPQGAACGAAAGVYGYIEANNVSTSPSART